MEKIGEQAAGPGKIYITGGGTAVLFGWRDTTVDVDLKLLPEPRGVFEAIAGLKDELRINIELASPDLFVPELPDWRERSRHIVTHGKVEFYHYDFYAQAIAKLERGHSRDAADVEAMVEAGLIEREKVGELFEQIESSLIRYPSIDAVDFRRKIDKFVGS